MNSRLGLLVVLSGCATAPPARAGADPVGERLSALPACQPGAEVGRLRVRPSICTKKACQAACCNQCSWAATLETKSGQPVPVDPARVQALLGVRESALDCEIAAWAEALAGLSVALDPGGCVVRGALSDYQLSMVLLLIVSLLAGGQTIYEWVDDQGQPHFTNDPHSIPEGANWRVTTGPEFVLTTSDSDAGAPAEDGGVSPPDAGTLAVDAGSPSAEDAGLESAARATADACTVARLRISWLEQRLQQGQQAAAQVQEQERLECQRRLITHGQPAYAACMAGRTEPALPSSVVQRQLAEAQEALRQAQQRGCLRASR